MKAIKMLDYAQELEVYRQHETIDRPRGNRELENAKVIKSAFSNSRECKNCGHIFFSKVNNKKTCSDTCSYQFNLKRARERHQAFDFSINNEE